MASKPIRILDATFEQLHSTLPGIGPAKARKVFDLVEQRKPFVYFEDLARVSDLSVAAWKKFEEEGYLIMPIQDLWDFKQHANQDNLTRLETELADLQQLHAETCDKLHASQQDIAECRSRCSNEVIEMDKEMAEKDLAFTQERQKLIDNAAQEKAFLLDEHAAELATLKSKHDTECADLAARISHLQNEVTEGRDVYNRDRIALENRLTAAQNSNQMLLDGFDQERMDLNGKIAHAQAELRSLQTDADEERSQLEARIRNLEDANQGLTDGFDAERLQLNAEIGRLSALVDSDDPPRAALVNDLRGQLDAARQENAVLRDENDAIRNELHKGLQLHKDLQQQRDELISDHQLEVQDLKAKLDDARQQIPLVTGLSRASETALPQHSGRVESMLEEILAAVGRKPSSRVSVVDGYMPSPSALQRLQRMNPGAPYQREAPSSAAHQPSFLDPSIPVRSHQMTVGGSPDLKTQGVPPPGYANIASTRQVPVHQYGSGSAAHLRTSVGDSPIRGHQSRQHEYARVPPSRSCDGEQLWHREFSQGRSCDPGNPRNNQERDYVMRSESEQGHFQDYGERQQYSSVRMDGYTSIPERGGHQSRSQHRGNGRGLPYARSGEYASPGRYFDRASPINQTGYVREEASSWHGAHGGGRDNTKNKSKEAHRSPSSDSSSSLFSDSEFPISDEDDRTYKKGSKRPAGPPPPKMATFSGTSGTWRAFFLQFKLTAKHYRWTESLMLSRLLESLRGKAIEYVYSQSSSLRRDFRKLVKALDSRFGDKEHASMRRRQLSSAIQEEDESLDDWADRVAKLVRESYRHSSDEVHQDMSVEAFFRGCKEKRAVLSVVDRKPKTLQAALRMTKTSVGNLRAFFGKSYSSRQVAFNVEDTSSRRSHSEESTQLKRLADQVENLTRRLEQSERRSSSPVKGKCFRCGSPKHLSQDCTAAPATSAAAKPSAPGSPSRSSVCFTCQQPGHFSRDCPKKSRPRSQSPSPSRTSSRSSSPAKSLNE